MYCSSVNFASINATISLYSIMEGLMKEIVAGWQEMEGKDKVVCVVDKACESERVRQEVERLYRSC